MSFLKCRAPGSGDRVSSVSRRITWSLPPRLCVAARCFVSLKPSKTHIDYGCSKPCSWPSTPLSCPQMLCGRRRYISTEADILLNGLAKFGWVIDKPKASMFVWAHCRRTPLIIRICRDPAGRAGVRLYPAGLAIREKFMSHGLGWQR
jgi:hypothetical protein